MKGGEKVSSENSEEWVVPDYFWIGNEYFAHIVETTEDSESPSGNEAQHYIAYCGRTEDSWTTGTLPQHHFANEEEIERMKKPLCPKCLAIKNAEVEDTL